MYVAGWGGDSLGAYALLKSATSGWGPSPRDPTRAVVGTGLVRPARSVHRKMAVCVGGKHAPQDRAHVCGCRLSRKNVEGSRWAAYLGNVRVTASGRWRQRRGLAGTCVESELRVARALGMGY